MEFSKSFCSADQLHQFLFCKHGFFRRKKSAIRRKFPIVHVFDKTVMDRIVVDVMDEIQQVFNGSDLMSLKWFVEQTSHALLLFIERLRIGIKEMGKLKAV